MFAYVVRRLLLIVPVVVGAITILFLLFYALPGDPVEVIAGGANGRAIPEATRDAIAQRYGLDDPLVIQYGNYWKDVVQGDLGESFQNNRSVNDVLGQFGAASVRLAFWAIIIEIIIGVTTGVVSAMRQYSFSDALVTVSTAAVSAVPVFVLGYLLITALAVVPNQHDWPEWARFQVQGMGPNDWSFFFIPRGEQWRFLVLPAVTLASVSTAIVARMTRTTMLEVNRADYMRTARAKGLSERRVVFGHGLRNAMIPVVTLIGLDLGTLIGSAILTETVFAWPGLGSAIARAIVNRDSPVVLGLTLVLVIVYVLINLIVDISYGWFDPRIRTDKART